LDSFPNRLFLKVVNSYNEELVEPLKSASLSEQPSAYEQRLLHTRFGNSECVRENTATANSHKTAAKALNAFT
jgi:hypothetical protein